MGLKNKGLTPRWSLIVNTSLVKDLYTIKCTFKSPTFVLGNGTEQRGSPIKLTQGQQQVVWRSRINLTEWDKW